MKAILIGAIVVLILIVGGYFLLHKTEITPEQIATTPTGQSTAQSVSTPAGVSFSYDVPYGLATDPSQIAAKAYIPPCEEGFDYCLYRTGSDYADTNFESAGLAIKNRKDLTTQAACLSTQPAGYTNLHATTSVQSGYATSVISPVGDAAAGHYASGAEYRLWTGSTCYQFATRIGETQFANYPAGTKEEFTAADRNAVMGELKALLSSVQVNGVHVVFPS